ncbi:hypothetical protein [Pelagicoccus sp. SDUM812003]|uniref:TVP38/TMEM64 family protein n=1 Tax=Pelagicoccus sp. SDUM812003 TaxID=3041267 RepID=UPI00280F5564|nr:hypothetical protein [Pelagicoccus sp. SDUM812003]MDQ8203375.1 hypothetical protein [Pelagicoccus sp. SDUM812003]
MAGLVLGALGAVVLFLALPYLPSAEDLRRLVGRVAEMGPLLFFGAMAILPLFWFPLSPFILLAPVFGKGVAIAGTIVALACNMALSWVLAGRWFRPFFHRLVGRFGYSVPTVSEKGMVGMTVALRLTPGVPFPLQNYLLGLAGMPFGLYMAVSVPLNAIMCASLILLGDALLKGSVGMLVAGALVFFGVALGARWLRMRLRARAMEGGRDGVG